MSRTVVLLGPQRLVPTVADAVRQHAPGVLERGTAVTITAGWEERELEDTELVDHLGGRVTNLELFRRVEDVFQRDPELLRGMRQRYDRVRRLQVLYRLRLSHALQATRELMGKRLHDPDDDLLEHEIHDSLAAVRLLDAQHLARLREVHAAFDEELRPFERDELAQHRGEVHRLVAEAGAVFIAGGHVAVLLNRLRLFDLATRLDGLPVFAWSAGAMALSPRIVAFHDSPPQGKGDPEVLEPGLDLVPEVVPLPHASRRLRLEDPIRVELFARRFGPGPCVALDEKSEIAYRDGEYVPGPSTRVLREDGSVELMEGAA